LATGEYNIVRIWDASNGQEYAKYNHAGGTVCGLCFSSDSKTLVSSCNDYSIIAFNVQTKT